MLSPSQAVWDQYHLKHPCLASQQVGNSQGYGQFARKQPPQAGVQAWGHYWHWPPGLKVKLSVVVILVILQPVRWRSLRRSRRLCGLGWQEEQ